MRASVPAFHRGAFCGGNKSLAHTGMVAPTDRLAAFDGAADAVFDEAAEDVLRSQWPPGHSCRKFQCPFVLFYIHSYRQKREYEVSAAMMRLAAAQGSALAANASSVLAVCNNAFFTDSHFAELLARIRRYPQRRRYLLHTPINPGDASFGSQLGCVPPHSNRRPCPSLCLPALFDLMVVRSRSLA